MVSAAAATNSAHVLMIDYCGCVYQQALRHLLFIFSPINKIQGQGRASWMCGHSIMTIVP